MKRYRRYLSVYCYMKEANLKSLYIVWFHFYDILEDAKLWRQWKVRCLSGAHEFMGIMNMWSTVQWNFLWYCIFDYVVLGICHVICEGLNTMNEKTWNKLKSILLCEKSQFGKPVHQMIPTTTNNLCILRTFQ